MVLSQERKNPGLKTRTTAIAWRPTFRRSRFAVARLFRGGDSCEFVQQLLVLLAERSQERSVDGKRHGTESAGAAGWSEGDRSVARDGGADVLDVACRHGSGRHQSRKIAGRGRLAPHGAA